MESEGSTAYVNKASRLGFGNERDHKVEDNVWKLGTVWYERCFLFLHVGEERKRLLGESFGLASDLRPHATAMRTESVAKLKLWVDL